MSRQPDRQVVGIRRLEDHPNLAEILGVLGRLGYIADDELPRLAEGWLNNGALAEARDKALAPDSPLVLETLSAFEAVGALFAEDLLGSAPYVTVDPRITTVALKTVRDAVAAVYARPVLTSREHADLLRPWRAVYPSPAADEPGLGPHGDLVTALLEALQRLAERCHDAAGQALFDALVDRSYVAEADRAEAAESAFQAAVLTQRRRMWALVRRTGTEGLCRPCAGCRTRGVQDRDTARVLTLCLDAACALLVTDALPDACSELLTGPVTALIPLQRPPGRST